jgi:hypothetical protein
MVTARMALILSALVQMLGSGMSQAQSSKVIGSWKVEVAFQSGESRSLRFEALGSGKGSFLLVVPKPVQVLPAVPSAAEWTQTDSQSITFSGPVQFPLGNVGLQRGILILKGKFETDGTITGEAKFFASDQETISPNPKAEPLKSGSFKAIRITG